MRLCAAMLVPFGLKQKGGWQFLFPSQLQTMELVVCTVPTFNTTQCSFTVKRPLFPCSCQYCPPSQGPSVKGQCHTTRCSMLDTFSMTSLFFFRGASSFQDKTFMCIFLPIFGASFRLCAALFVNKSVVLGLHLFQIREQKSVGEQSSNTQETSMIPYRPSSTADVSGYKYLF